MSTMQAESPEGSNPRKPIYDDYEAPPPYSATPDSPPTRHSEKPTKSRGPTPTDRLAVQIGKARLFLHGHVAAAETKVNEIMDSALDLESSFTSTIASLAPSPQSGEKLMPGAVYVLVAAMAGSIVTRNRNIILRAAAPLAVGVGAGWAILPVTMRNVSDLLWKYEEKFPVIASSHIRTRESIEQAWATAKAHSQHTVHIIDAKIGEGREAVESWVKKGK
ncbi:apolipo protein O-domain-containing protein [Xylogone sp. PMI_703]|nr:apolipo protein O-domain-containing protein [Xylogone sp. PMI_703]